MLAPTSPGLTRKSYAPSTVNIFGKVPVLQNRVLEEFPHVVEERHN
jgi:hypothetical protein